jgi:hypothetical protein
VNPLNYYFKFRADKLRELKDDPNRAKVVKKLWREMDEKGKDKLKADFDGEVKKYTKDLEEWKKKYNIKDDEVKTRELRIQDKSKEESKEKKGDKVKGAEKAGKKEDKSAEKGKGKSKDDKKKEASKGKGKK